MNNHIFKLHRIGMVLFLAFGFVGIANSIDIGMTGAVKGAAKGLDEKLTQPRIISGSHLGLKTFSYSYVTDEPVSNKKHEVEHRFDWGDGTYSDWSKTNTSVHAWSTAGLYQVRTQSRCRMHNSYLSQVSEAFEVSVQSETVSSPTKPVGTTSAIQGTAYSYTLGNSESNLGHIIEYRFDWGDGTYSAWGTTTSASHIWSVVGTYLVKAEARCQADTGVTAVSSGISVVIGAAAETISAPNTPSGSASGTAGTSYPYTTGGSVSSIGHAIEYRFNWGDGSYSSWSQTATASHSWSTVTIYKVKAEVRCAVDTGLSATSAEFSVVIGAAPAETVSTSATPEGDSSIANGTTYTYTSVSGTSSLGHTLESRFDWGDSTYSTWSSTLSASHSWSTAGTYNLKVETRCASHTTVSSVSSTLPVTAGTFSGTANWVLGTNTPSYSYADLAWVVTFAGKMWLIGGGYAGVGVDDVYSSSDGVTWTLATGAAAFGNRYGHACVVFGGKIWLIGGYDGTSRKDDVWSSTDGITWIQVTASGGYTGRDRFVALAYGGKLWVMGGTDSGGALNDVWSSTDGITWTQTKVNAFGGLATDGPAGTVFNGKMWVFGCAGSGSSNPVWYSTDGITWTQATSNAAYGSVHGISAVTYRGKMVVTGGTDSGSRNANSWYSSDGSSWTQMTGTNYSPARTNHGFTVFNDKIWVIGGDLAAPINDAWHNP